MDIKKLRSVSNGNRTFMSDFVSVANTLFNVVAGLPFRSGKNFHISGATVTGGSNPNLTIGRYGGVFMGNKFFGSTNDADTLTVPKGYYLYAIAELDTTQPRTSTTGVSYSQNYAYSLVVSSTAQTGLSTNYDDPTGKWEIINGAQTGALSTELYVAYMRTLLIVWDWSSLPPTLPDNSVMSSSIADGAVTSGKLGNNAVRNTNISAGSVSSLALASQSVTQQKIFPGVVEAREEAVYQLGVSTGMPELKWNSTAYFTIPSNAGSSSSSVSIDWGDAPVSVIHVFVVKQNSTSFSIGFNNKLCVLPAETGTFLIHVVNINGSILVHASKSVG